MAEELTPAEEAVVEVEEAAELSAEPEVLAEPAAEEIIITEEPAAEEAVVVEEPAAKKPVGGKKIKAATAEEAAQPAAVEPPAVQEFTLPSVSHGVAGSTHIAVSHRNR